MKWLKRLLIALFIIVALIIFFWSRSTDPVLPVSIGINAVPWAEVFIQSSETNEEISYGYTPITVDVPIGAKVILRQENKEKVFPYEVWKDEQTISHDFLNQ